MSENFENKKAVVEEIKEHIKSATGIFLINYKGITVSADTALRSSFRKVGVDYKVYKNRLMKRAFEELDINFDPELFNGTSAVAFAKEDCLAPARVVKEKQEELKDFSIKAAFVENKFYDAQGVKILSNIPAKEVLLAQLLGMLKSPMQKFAVAINEVAKKNA